MKWLFTLMAPVLLTSMAAAQNVKGIWRGYFYSGNSIFPEKYKYEIQINELPSKALEGVTYTYKNTTFYAKCGLQGINFRNKNKFVTIREVSTLELRMQPGTTDCPMSCELTYSNEDGREMLKGTYKAVNSADGSDCGGGYVYLEKVPESEFQKENFLNKKATPGQALKSPPLKSGATARQGTVTPKATRPPATTRPSRPLPAKPPVARTKPAAPATGNNKPPRKDTASIAVIPPIPPPVADKPTVVIPEKKTLPQPPAVLKERENKLVQTIVTPGQDITIQLYDNGEIDHDTITVYHNNRVIADRKMLNRTPITIHVKATAEDPDHEFVMVANNLGDISPNTALMVITTGGKKYETFLSTNEKNNAKVVIRYQPPTEQ
jgi:hypothetical protein